MSQPDDRSNRPGTADPTREPDVAEDDEEPQEEEEEERPPDFRLYTGEPLETEDGTFRPMQQNAGRYGSEGGGEFPDPATPARAPAPGAFDDDAGDGDAGDGDAGGDDVRARPSSP